MGATDMYQQRLEWEKLTPENRPSEDDVVKCRSSNGEEMIGIVWMQSGGRFHCVGISESMAVTHFRYLDDEQFDVGSFKRQFYGKGVDDD